MRQIDQPAMNSRNTPRPHSLAELFWAFTWLALQGFGGVLAVVQVELVERRQWLTREEFIEDWAVAQIMPGPNVVNLSMMIGDRYFGLRGALAALAGMLLFPLLIVLTLAALLAGVADTPQVQGALRGMGDNGEEQVFRVVKIKGPEVHLDGNHPLAGVALKFSVAVTGVRAALPEEIAHRHVHGAHGHHH